MDNSTKVLTEMPISQLKISLNKLNEEEREAVISLLIKTYHSICKDKYYKKISGGKYERVEDTAEIL